jgi:hypothetical protein
MGGFDPGQPSTAQIGSISPMHAEVQLLNIRLSGRTTGVIVVERLKRVEGSMTSTAPDTAETRYLK